MRGSFCQPHCLSSIFDFDGQRQDGQRQKDEAMTRQRRTSLAGFWGLCVLLGSAWVLRLTHPAAHVTLRALGSQSVVLCMVFGVLGRREFSFATRSRWIRVVLWGSVLALPAVLSTGANVTISAVTLTLIFTLVPVATVLVSTQQNLRFGPDERAMQLMVPAIAGVGGAALLLPFSVPEGIAAQIWFALAVVSAVLTGIALVRLHPLLQGLGVRAASSAVCAGWAILCGGLLWLDPPTAQVGWRETLLFETSQTCLTAALIVLTLWLLQRWTPAQVSARYVAVPLVTIVEGAGLLRPQISWTIVLGLAMLAVSVVLLIREEATDSVDALTE